MIMITTRFGGLNCLVAFTGLVLMTMGGMASERFDLRKSATGAWLSGTELKEHVEQIDSLVDAGLKEQGVVPNAMTSDPIFLRRAYLDITGRIPTLEQAAEFLQTQSATKRRDLIDRLIQSEGNVSREFNYWADLLRIQSRLRNAPAGPYLDWIKDSIRENRPYDEMVRELISAEGYVWDNGAAGYYLRDAGMPLDHMANTFQVFLGTQLVCAQCHDHPYDEFTQIDYYQQAAYIFGVKTTDREISQQYRKLGRKKKSEVDPDTQRMARQMIRPLRYRVNETNSKLRLPDDYQYDDAKPKSVVEPDTIFGDSIELGPDESPRDGYAKWLTSPENPRFATVIANRLWKRSMGVGLIEPVDDLSDGYSASHPQLMTYLSELIVDLNFDTRAYLKVLYNTRAYQRMANRDEWDSSEPYYFAGPLLRRMRAEELWDSFAGLVVQDLDERSGNSSQNTRYSEAKELVGMEPDAILKIAEDRAKVAKKRTELQAQQRELRKQLQAAQANKRSRRVRALRDEQNALSKKIRMLGQNRGGRNRGSDANDPRWKGLPRELVRASETVSPAPPRHFLRQFGQSDRETIENANDEANVPQILTLLNGPLYEMLSKPNSVFRQAYEGAGNAEQLLNRIYLTLLTRFPSELERQQLLPALRNDPQGATEDLIWSLLNTRQFAFVQ